MLLVTPDSYPKIVAAHAEARRPGPELADVVPPEAGDFGWVTQKLMDIADTSAGGRIVSVLEGGYDLQGLQESVAAHLTALMGTTSKP